MAERLEVAWPDPVCRVLIALEAAGHEAYVVGGCVRDLLLGRPVRDYDVATDATPDRVQALFPRTRLTGVKHGTVTVLVGDMAVEVTTYRVESRYSDGRRPDHVTFTPHLQLDLARRDFTVNAVAVSLRGEVVDPYGGRADLRCRRIRAVGDPELRFREDGLRLMRAIRFAAELGFDIEAGTLDGMHRAWERLKCVARERIGQEWMRVAASDWWRIAGLVASGPWLAAMPAPCGQLRAGFEALAADPAAAGRWQRWVTADSVPLPLPAVALATWIYAADSDATVAAEVARALAWPGALGRQAAAVAALARDDPAGWTPDRWREQLFAAGRTHVLAACTVLDVLKPGAGGPAVVERSPAGADHPWRTRLYQTYAAAQPLWSLQELAVDGGDLTALGFRGRAVGEALRRLARDVLSGTVANRREALLSRLEAYREDGA
ncbi:MAG: hypothetical protein IRZ33_08510 [Alicyclobacillaceae bacterium]|nr:hypothetical protein [Alicyclobacillaceae bacterium]